MCLEYVIEAGDLCANIEVNGESYVLQENVDTDTSIFGCTFNGVYKKVGDSSSKVYCFKEEDLTSGGYQFQCASTPTSSPMTTTTTTTIEKVSENVNTIVEKIKNFMETDTDEAKKLTNILSNFESILGLLKKGKRVRRSTGKLLATI